MIHKAGWVVLGKGSQKATLFPGGAPGQGWQLWLVWAPISGPLLVLSSTAGSKADLGSGWGGGCPCVPTCHPLSWVSSACRLESLTPATWGTSPGWGSVGGPSGAPKSTAGAQEEKQLEAWLWMLGGKLSPFLAPEAVPRLWACPWGPGQHTTPPFWIGREGLKGQGSERLGTNAAQQG